MSGSYDPGPLRTWEIAWLPDGRRQRVRGHQISWSGAPAGPKTVSVHGQIDGKWRLVVAAQESAILLAARAGAALAARYRRAVAR